MNRAETQTIVTYLNRAGLLQALEGQAAVWHDAIGRLDFTDAQAACRALAESRTGNDRWVTPGDVRAGVRAIRARRTAGITPPAPPVPLDVARDIAWRREYVRARGDGSTDQAAQDTANHVLGITPEPLIGPPTAQMRALAAKASTAPDRTKETTP